MGTLIAGMLAAAGSATAGGSWLETEDRYYSPGDIATARERFSTGQLEGRLSDGPYYAYLVPGFRWFPTPGPIPEYAIPVGEFDIRRLTGNFCCWVARLIFTVPDVPAGRYSIAYCNDPCTVNGIGDLMGGSFFVGETQEQARLIARVEHLEMKLESVPKIRADLRKTEAALADAGLR